jgi:hypothetical protein
MRIIKVIADGHQQFELTLKLILLVKISRFPWLPQLKKLIEVLPLTS